MCIHHASPGLRVGADEQDGVVGAHPVVDIGLFAQEVEAALVLPGKEPIAGLALHEDHPVGDLAGGRIAQFDLPVDAGVERAVARVPVEAHLVDHLVDEGDSAVADVRARADLLHAPSTFRLMLRVPRSWTGLPAEARSVISTAPFPMTVHATPGVRQNEAAERPPAP
jgi:hypothetical protein